MAKIKRDSWAIVERVVRRYPENKKEYDEYMEEIMSSSSQGGSSTEGQVTQSDSSSVVERKALKMNSQKMDRIKREINAVEYVYKNLQTEEQKIIRTRYWRERWRNIPYTKIEGVSYSERQMKRIIYKTIMQVASQLGEI